MNWKKGLPLIGLIILALIAITIRHFHNDPAESSQNADRGKTITNDQRATRGLNRNPAHISYSKHARCRMGCRQIDEKEVVDLLRNGKINYRKSDLKSGDCNKKYAVEGYSRDKQHLRIVFAPCQDEVTVVTVIDLGKEWPCDCN